MRVLQLLAKLRYVFFPFFVCWHRKMSRPFTRNGESYRVCLRCGAHRQFDLKEWKTKGYYYNPRERQNPSAPLREAQPRLQLVERAVKKDTAVPRRFIAAG